MGLTPGSGSGPGGDAYAQGMHPSLNRFMLPSQEFVTCVLWNGLYHITGTDIVRALVFRFEAFGRPVRNMKKFEEGVFSDLRNLKPGVDACLEEPKSPFLDLLFKYQCIRTQKKQKVFYWFSVPHDRLFLDALERDLKREKMGLETTTQVVGEPALSFTYDSKRSLYEQFAKAQGVKDGEGELESAVRRAEQDGLGTGTSSESDADLVDGANGMGNLHIDTEDSEMSDADEISGLTEEEREKRRKMRQEHQRKRHLQKINGGSAFFSNLFGLFEGSPTYKQRRKKNPTAGSALSRSVSNSSSTSFRKGSEDYDERGRPRSIGPYGSDRHHSTSVSRERSYPYPHPYSVSRSFYPSMADEFGPGSLDYQERAEPDAAEMFHKQARQQLAPADGIVRKPKVPHVLPEVGVMISEGYHAHQLQGIGGQHSFPSQPRHLSSDVQQQPSLDPAYPNADGFDPSTSMYPQQQQSLHPTEPAAQNSGTTQYETISPDGKFRAFMCPLLSCGRLFKRMEHLKRHLRTHTMERPYTCPMCQKRFSRSDNLNQHLRTHERTGSSTGSTGANSTSSNFAGAGAGGGSGMDTSMTMWRESNEESDFSGAESEGYDEEGFMRSGLGQQMIGGSNEMFGMGMMNSAVMGQMGAGFDMQMCEVEVQAGDVSEIPGGEEEGLVLRTSAGMVNFAAQPQQQQQQQPNAIYGAGNLADAGRWPARSPPPFGGANVPSPPPGGLPSNRSSIGSSPAGYIRPTHSASSSTSSLSAYNGTNGTTEDYVTSLSAPSHKQGFDHGTLYSSGGLDNAASLAGTGSNNGGPSRRHRSMTPNLIRNGEPVRRPMTAGSGELAPGGGSPGSGSGGANAGMGSRGYHPYAGGYTSSSRAGSTHSSPALYNVPLGGDGSQGLRRPESRTSFVGSQDQMQALQPPQQGDVIFRTDSPASFQAQSESPAPFTMDLPPHSMYSHPHANTVPTVYDSSQQLGVDGVYYPHQHPTL